MKGFSDALNGLKTALSSEINLKTQIGAATLAVFCGWFFKISTFEWLIVISCIGLVISLELINTAIEYLVDFISPDMHPKAGKIKDIAAGAVLIVALNSLVVGLIIFVPKLLHLIDTMNL